MSSKIVINGVTYTGNNIVISNGKVKIDGVDGTPNEKEISIVVHGNLETLDANSCETIEVNGSVKRLENMNGNVICWNVDGNVKNMNGNIVCGDVSGSVSAMNGNVNRK